MYNIIFITVNQKKMFNSHTYIEVNIFETV